MFMLKSVLEKALLILQDFGFRKPQDFAFVALME